MARRLIVLFGKGGLSDVGRHAILAGLQRPDVGHICVVTEYPELLEEPNWKCGCPEPHTNPFNDKSLQDKLKLVKVDSWLKAPPTNLAEHFAGADAVISCLGHRQVGMPEARVAYAGNKHVVDAMKANKIERVVVCSSAGIREDWPPMEYHWAGKIFSLMLLSCARPNYNDLASMEELYWENAGELDFLFVRPAGLSEDVLPVGKSYAQKEKGKDVVGIELAKMDCAAYMVEEALHPTLHRKGVVVGGAPPETGKDK